MATWGWPGVSFHAGPLQADTEPWSEVKASNHSSPSICSSHLLKLPEFSLVHPRAHHRGQEKCSVIIGLSWHKWGRPSLPGGAQHHLQES